MSERLIKMTITIEGTISEIPPPDDALEPNMEYRHLYLNGLQVKVTKNYIQAHELGMAMHLVGDFVLNNTELRHIFHCENSDDLDIDLSDLLNK